MYIRVYVRQRFLHLVLNWEQDKSIIMSAIKGDSNMTDMIVIWEKNGIILQRNEENGLLILRMDRDENLFDMEMVNLLSIAIQKVERFNHPKSLLICGSSPNKFFSNGHDLGSVDQMSDMYTLVQSTWKKVLAPLLVMDCTTCACVNGHAFGAGFFLALSCDYRIMRTKRGFLNFPELNLGMPLSIGYAELAKSKVPESLWRQAILTGKRYTSTEALKLHLIDQETSIDQLEPTCIKFLSSIMEQQSQLMKFDPSNYSAMKKELYKDAYRALTMGHPKDPPHSRL